MKFTELDLPQFILDAINSLGFEKATEIQEKSLPIIRAGNDMVGKSKTGSGKTFAYGIPAIEKVDTSNKNTQVLVISPTRELASQICDELRKITGFVEGCRVVPVFGGSNMVQQIKALRSGARIVVGTPGRLMDHLERKTLNLKNLKMLVLDEADEMLNMGFKEDIETILKSVNDDHQTVMFSATMPPEILKITKNYMKEPQFVEIEEKELDSHISQKYFFVGLKEKQKALNYILETQKPRLSIIFSNTKRMVETIVNNLTKEGFSALGLHGDMRQGERKRVMQHIKSLTQTTAGVNLLVASDVAARGIDISDVDMVINYDIPNNSDYYIHRIGRTGRAGKLGIAYSIVNTEMQVKDLKDYAKTKNLSIEEEICYLSKSSSNSENKEDRPKRNYSNRESSNRRNNNDRKPRFERSDKPSYDRDRKPRFDKNEKPSYDRDRKPRFERSDKPSFDRDRKPRFDRDRKPRFERSDKPSFDGDRKPRFDRSDKPSFDRDRKPRFDRNDKPSFDRDRKPRFDRNDKPSFDGERKPRFDRDKKSGFGRSRNNYRSNEFNDDGRDIFIIRTNRTQNENSRPESKNNERYDKKERTFSKFGRENKDYSKKTYDRKSNNARSFRNKDDNSSSKFKKPYENKNFHSNRESRPNYDK